MLVARTGKRSFGFGRMQAARRHTVAKYAIWNPLHVKHSLSCCQRYDGAALPSIWTSWLSLCVRVELSQHVAQLEA
jgi:hypothetical protein